MSSIHLYGTLHKSSACSSPHQEEEEGKWHWSEWTGMWAFGDVSTWLPLLSLEKKDAGVEDAVITTSSDPSIVSRGEICRSLEDAGDHKFTPDLRQKGPLPFAYKCLGRVEMEKASASEVSEKTMDDFRFKKDKQEHGQEQGQEQEKLSDKEMKHEEPTSKIQKELQEVTKEESSKENDVKNLHNDTQEVKKDSLSKDLEMKEEHQIQIQGGDKENEQQERIGVSESTSIILKETTIENKALTPLSKKVSKSTLRWKWRGEFLNVSKRMDRTPLKTVEETFELEMNGLEVKGYGQNRFGKFQLIGSLKVSEDGSTATLICQKIYIVDTSGATSSSSKKRGRGRPPRNSCSPNKETPNSAKSGEGKSGSGSGYYTRKRMMSWQRPLFHDEFDADNHPTIAQEQPINSSAESQAKIRSNTTLNKDSKALPVTPTATIGNTSHQPRKRGRPPSSMNRTKSIDLSTGVSSNNHGPTNNTSATGKLATTGGMQGPRSKLSSQKQTVSAQSGENIGLLPSTCDPLEARWLSAHYMDINGVFCIYEGDLDFGGHLRHGQGVTMYPDGYIYTGSFKYNKEHGYGTLTNPSGKLVYEGEWERGKIHGHGIYHYEPSGAIYQGEFSMNLRQGIGIYTFKDGSYYDGEWQNNVRCGRGLMRWVDGSIYDGQWRANERHGQGTLKASDGFKYEGQWAHNSMEGRGVAEYRNGNPDGEVIQRYEGLWHKGRKEGRGTVVFVPQGASYEGRFKNDKMEGQGTLKMLDTTQSIGNLGGESMTDSDCDWLIPIEFQSDMAHIHSKAGFTSHGE